VGSAWQPGSVAGDGAGGDLLLLQQLERRAEQGSCLAAVKAETLGLLAAAARLSTLVHSRDRSLSGGWDAQQGTRAWHSHDRWMRAVPAAKLAPAIC
jgi:hypothetical protein